MLPKEFFDLQVEFARKVSVFESIPLEEALLFYTSFYRMFWIPSEEFDPKHEMWVQYLIHIDKKGVKPGTYDFYKQRLIERKVDPSKKYSGKSCFTHEVKNNYVNLHFENQEGSDQGPLSKERMSGRVKELRNLFSKVINENPEVNEVHGYSWLYNIEAYRRLFPKRYLDSAEVSYDDFKSFYIWGQFLDSSYENKKEIIETFRKNIQHSENIDKLFKSFPLQPLRLKGDIKEFYEFFNII